jgi:hypothetical protein
MLSELALWVFCDSLKTAVKSNFGTVQLSILTLIRHYIHTENKNIRNVWDLRGLFYFEIYIKFHSKNMYNSVGADPSNECL